VHCGEAANEQQGYFQGKETSRQNVVGGDTSATAHDWCWDETVQIVSDWRTTPDGRFTLNVINPANTSATVYLPAGENNHVTEGGKPVEVRRGPAGFVTCAIGSGSYEFQVN
jgi:Bacterial alpha-L-rhamnosidase C-terminal domain